MVTSIDVIIPSYRPDEKYLLPLLRLRPPEGTTVRFFIVIDNPAVTVPASVQAQADNDRVTILINPKNMGSAHTRNRGINAASAEWFILLDDDVLPDEDLLRQYVQAFEAEPDATGFIGLVRFPEISSSFTEAVVASGSRDIFSIAEHCTEFAWAATANVAVRRSAIGEIRMTETYPVTGGGEDVDFFLLIMNRNNGKRLRCLPGAVVYHPWWNNGHPDYRRPFWYGFGNAMLGTEHPKLTYYDFLNTPETLLLLCVLLFIPGWTHSVLLLMAGVVLTELIASAVQTQKRRPGASLLAMFHVALLRVTHEAGVLWGKLRKGQLYRIGERFHDDGRVQKLYFYRSNTYRTVKWLLYPALVIVVVLWHSTR